MLKPVLGVAAGGIVGFILWKLLAAFLLPMLGVAVGVVFLVLKLVFIVSALLILGWLFRRWSAREASAG